jgi:hypothetical protein
MAAKAAFGFPRSFGFTLSGGNWLALYPLNALQVLPLSQVARSYDATTASTSILATGAAPVIAAMVALVGHNMSQAATIRLRCWSDVARTTQVFDSGTENVWPASYTAAELAGAIWTWYRRFSGPTPGSSGMTVGALQIDITDTGNTAGYVEAGFLEIAAAYDATYNFEWGSQYGFEWRSQVIEAIGGAEYVDRRPKPRIFKGSFPFTKQDEALGKFYEMQRQLDMDQPILFVPFPDVTAHLLRTIVFARQMDPGLSALRTRAGAVGLIHSVPLALKEIIG